MSSADAVEVAKIATAFFGGSVASFFIQALWTHWTRPKLKLISRHDAGLLVRTPGMWLRPNQQSIPEEFMFLRILVKNDGLQTARACIPYIHKIIWIQKGGEEMVFSGRDLIDMQWSWRGHAQVDIPRGAYHYVDLFKFWKSDLGSLFCSDRFPSYLQKWGRGGGQLYIYVKVCCDNAVPADAHVHFEWDGTWEGKAQIIT